MGEKRKGRRAYLNDFTTNLRGDYVYQGSHFHYVGETPWEKRFRKLWGLTLAMAIGLVGGGLLPAAGMNGVLYVVVPYLASVIAGASVVWAMAKLRREGKLRSYVYEASIRKLPTRGKVTAVFAVLAAAGEGLNLLLNGSGGKTAATLGYLALTLLAALAAWRLAGESAATAWEERREGGTDIGL